MTARHSESWISFFVPLPVNVVKNARLAAKLTGYRIDIKSETAYEEYLENLASPVLKKQEEASSEEE